MKGIHRLNHKDYIGVQENNLYYYEITGSERNAKSTESTKETFSDWSESPIDVGDYKVIPFGADNDIPKKIQESVFPNSLAPRLQNRKIELLFEQGPYLYQHVKDGRKYFREPVEESKIQEWLDSIGYEDILLANATDYYYQNQVFNKVRRELGYRLGDGGLGAIEHQPAFDCRLAYRRNDKKKVPTHVLVADWDNLQNEDVKVYPLYDRMEPTKHRLSMHWSKFASFGKRDYPVPDIYGSLEWIDRSTSIPKIFMALTENSLNIKWHIQSPAAYWDRKRSQLKENCQSQQPPIQYKEQMLVDLKEQILEKLSSLLSGVENVGKFWHNEYVIELIGANAVEQGWKIMPIEQKIEEYVTAQIKISEKADFATVAGLGLHAALGNVGADGKSDSGSEQLYALKIHQLTSVNIAEYHVCKSINDSLKAKFNTNIKIGFYHINPEREQDITQSQRIANNTPSNQ